MGVVGNGPPAIALSLFLSGAWPIYRGNHPDAALNGALATGLAGDGSLLRHDLASLCAGHLDALNSRGNNPLGRLFDALHHPLAEGGGVRPTCIDLQRRPGVSHLVLGKNPPGGSWHAMAEGMLSLSPGFWMELPGWPLFDWGRSHNLWLDPAQRLPRAQVAAYFADYVAHMGLTDHFVTGVQVVSARRDGDEWRVEADVPDGVRYYRFKKLVLATGMYDRPRRLEIEGEGLPWVTDRASGCANGAGPLLVVGAGLSAADGILAARAAGREVVHAFIDDPAATPMARLDANLYPEYHHLVTLMAGAGEPGYVPLANTRLTAIGADGRCRMSGPDGEGQLNLEGVADQLDGKRVAILIGSDPDLDFLTPQLPWVKGALGVDPQTFRVGPDGLYAMGPLAGDNFVRFITGHALGVARDILLAEGRVPAVGMSE